MTIAQCLTFQRPSHSLLPRPKPYLNRASLYLQAEDPGAALPDLDSAADLDPENPSLYLVRAQVHLLLGNIAKAEADLLQVMSVSLDEDQLAAARRLLTTIR